MSRSVPPLPRSYERGLIEAASTLHFEESTSTLPRSYERGLIEARSLVVGRTYSCPFRVHTNAASLKHDRPQVCDLASLAFRVHTNAASLKRLNGQDASFVRDLLPRSYERGLIEAQHGVPERHPRRHRLPRSYERGLIEATNPRASPRAFRAFRVHTNAASLKHGHFRVGHLDRVIPSAFIRTRPH